MQSVACIKIFCILFANFQFIGQSDEFLFIPIIYIKFKIMSNNLVMSTNLCDF